ncbi:MAG: hypothetical protein ACLRS8_18305 [Parabacteroides merdae]
MSNHHGAGCYSRCSRYRYLPVTLNIDGDAGGARTYEGSPYLTGTLMLLESIRHCLRRALFLNTMKE